MTEPGLQDWNFIMKNRKLVCDSCNFKRHEVTMNTLDEADEHELANADHWVQIVDGEE